MTDDATIEEKQGFLRETILNKGYTSNDFTKAVKLLRNAKKFSQK